MRQFIIGIFFAIPLLFFLKHNIATLILSLTTIIFFFLNKYKKIISGTNFFIHLFFGYILINGIINLSIDNFLYLRFYFFLLLMNYFIKEEILKKNLIILILLISFLCIDLIFQMYTGYNLFGIKNTMDYSTSLFLDEKIAGSFLIKILLMILIYIIALKFDKKIILLSFFFPIMFIAVIASGQRMALFNFIFIAIATIIFIFLKFRKKNFLILLTLFVSLFFIFHNNLFEEKIIKRTKDSLITFLTNNQNNNNELTTITIYNLDNYDSIQLLEDVISKKNILFDDIFAYGFKNNHNEKDILSIKKFYNSVSRLHNQEFTINFNSPINDEIKKFYNLDQTKINFSHFINFFNNNNKKLQLNDEIISFTTTKNVKYSTLDNAWLSHSMIAINILKENIFFGVGIKNYRKYCYEEKYRNFDSILKDKCVTHPHNYIAEILSELGILGLLLFFFMIVFIIRNFLKSNKLKILEKTYLIVLIMIIFNPFQVTGRFFSSGESWFYTYIFIFINLLSKKNITKKIF